MTESTATTPAIQELRAKERATKKWLVVHRLVKEVLRDMQQRGVISGFVTTYDDRRRRRNLSYDFVVRTGQGRSAKSWYFAVTEDLSLREALAHSHRPITVFCFKVETKPTTVEARLRTRLGLE